MPKITPPPRQVDEPPSTKSKSWPPAVIREILRDRYDFERVDITGPKTVTVYTDQLAKYVPTGRWLVDDHRRKTKTGIQVKRKRYDGT